MFTYEDFLNISNGKNPYTVSTFLTCLCAIEFNYASEELEEDLEIWAQENKVNPSDILAAINDNRDTPVDLIIQDYDPDNKWITMFMRVEGYSLDVSCVCLK